MFSMELVLWALTSRMEAVYRNGSLVSYKELRQYAPSHQLHR